MGCGGTVAPTEGSACATTWWCCRSTTSPTRAASTWRRGSRATPPPPHHYGRLQYGEDLELTFRTLIGNGANPNVAAVVVIGIEPSWTHRGADRTARSGKPVESSSIERFGDLRTLAAAARSAQQLLQDASELRRE